MRSVTSFFNKTIFKSDYQRYWPIAFVYTLIWLAMPIAQWNVRKVMGLETENSMPPMVTYDFMLMVLIMAVIFGCLMAMAVFSYLMNSRSVGLMHSLPVRRGSLFLSHLSAGCSMLVLGNLVITVLMSIVQICSGAEVMYAVLEWFLMATVLDLIFYSIAVFCCMFTGWLLAVPVLYAGLNVVTAVLTALIQALGGLFYYGYDGGQFPEVTMWLTPVVKLFGLMTERWYKGPDGPIKNQMIYDIQGEDVSCARCLSPEIPHVLMVYAVAAVVLLAVAYLISRRRPSESAANPVAVRKAKPFFRYGLALLGGLGLGLAVYMMVTENLSSPRQVNMPVLLVCMIITGILCYFAVSMIIEKSFRVFGRKGWTRAMTISLALIILCFVMQMDLTGYEDRLPGEKEIETVSLEIYDFNLNIDQSRNSADISLAHAIHEEILDQSDRENNGGAIRIRYKLKNGDSISRRYFIPEKALSSGLRHELYGRVNSEEARRDRIIGSPDRQSADIFVGGQISDYRSGQTVRLKEEQAQNFYKAIEKDLRSGAGVQTNDMADGDDLVVEIILMKTSGEELYISRLPYDCEETQEYLHELGFANIYWSDTENLQ